MKRILNILFAASFMVLIACETVVTYDLPINDPKIVVEGFIENDLAPVVFLSRSFPFFGEVNVNNLDELLIPGAKIQVSEGNNTIMLKEYNKQSALAVSEEDFDNLIAPVIEQFIGFSISQGTLDSFSLFIPNFVFYTVAPEDITFVGELGKTYGLQINILDHPIFGTKQLTATTNIPNLVRLDSLWSEDHPNSENDTLFQLRARFTDPPISGNYYRIFNSVNSEPLYTANNSVFDDAFINGESIPFSVTKGQSEEDKLGDQNTDVDGYWSPGDTATVKFCSINEDHYQFWRTVENEKGNLGSPFGSFTIIASNVEGAVGIWGGYASSSISYIIPEL